jgi:hypothetical protein
VLFKLLPGPKVSSPHTTRPAISAITRTNKSGATITNNISNAISDPLSLSQLQAPFWISESVVNAIGFGQAQKNKKA